MNCKNLKQKLNKKLVCKITGKEVNFKNCNYSCKYFESKYKNLSEYKYKSTEKTLRNKSNKLARLERNRFSLFSDNKNQCYLCESTYKLTWHEIFRGSNRTNSMKYGLCLRLCLSCHELYQEDKEFNDYWRKKGQAMFNDAYPDLNFLDIFKRNYL